MIRAGVYPLILGFSFGWFLLAAMIADAVGAQGVVAVLLVGGPLALSLGIVPWFVRWSDLF